MAAHNSNISGSKTLSSIFESLTLPNGTPDINARRAALSALLNTLNFSDRRFVEDLLGDLRKNQDILKKLPTDLVLRIADFLTSPTDLFYLLSVSRGWNSLWSQDRVLRSMLSSNFPEDLDKASRRGIKLGGTGGRPLLQLYEASCRKAIRRQNGHFENSVAGYWRFPYDQNFEIEGVVPERELQPLPPGLAESEEVRPGVDQWLYSDGRLAWKYEFHVVVDDLTTMKRVIYDVPSKFKLSAPGIHLEALGDQLVVASINRSVLVWSLQTDRIAAITLPSPSVGVYVGGNVVGILTSNWSVFVYEYGKQVKQLLLPEDLTKSIARDAKKRERDIAMIIEPDLKDTIFLASVLKNKTGSMTYTVAKFENYKFVEKWQRPSFKKTGGWCSLRCYKANNAGLYTILLEISEKFEPCQDYLFENEFAEHYNHCWELLFDTKKEKFHTQHFHVPYVYDPFVGLMDISDKYKTWRGRMILNLMHEETMTTVTNCSTELHAGILLASLPACNITRETQPFRKIGPSALGGCHPFDGLRVGRHGRHPLLCCWDPCPDLELEMVLEPWKEQLSHRYDADDDFIVTFGTSGYSAWRFGEKIPLKRSEQELRKLYGSPREKFAEITSSGTDLDGLEYMGDWHDDVDMTFANYQIDMNTSDDLDDGDENDGGGGGGSVSEEDDDDSDGYNSDSDMVV